MNQENKRRMEQQRPRQDHDRPKPQERNQAQRDTPRSHEKRDLLGFDVLGRHRTIIGNPFGRKKDFRR